MRPNRTRREYLTAEEVAAYLGISAQTVRKLARSGDIPAQRYGKLWRFNPAAVKAQHEKKGEGA